MHIFFQKSSRSFLALALISLPLMNAVAQIGAVTGSTDISTNRASIVEFGAVADGATLNTEKIQSAI